MDRFDAMKVFSRVVERRSFTLTAQDLGLPRSTVTDVVKALEARLGVQLLHRTTRHVSPTLDGEAYYQRCVTLLADIEEAESAFEGARPKGLLRVEVQGTLARHFIMPNLPDFFRQYPEVELSMSEGERWVDPVREGVDCVVRFGNLADSDLIARRVVILERQTCASPAYIERHGMPTNIEALEGHRMVGLRSLTSGNLRPLEFTVDGEVRNLMLPTTISVTGTESFLASVRLGLGLAQLPFFHTKGDLARGTLVPILTGYPVPSAPVSILYPRSRQLSPRVRVFIDWVAQMFAAHPTGALGG